MKKGKKDRSREKKEKQVERTGVKFTSPRKTQLPPTKPPAEEKPSVSSSEDLSEDSGYHS